VKGDGKMKGAKTLEIKLEGYGDFFGTREGCLLIRDKNKKEKTFPLFENEIGSVILKTGNLTSVGALATCSFWGIDVLILTSRGNPVGILKSLEDDGYVQTRVHQYQALENGKGREIAKALIIAKSQGYNSVLSKFGLKPVGFVKDNVNAIEAEDMRTFRRKLMSLESKFSKRYFDQIFKLFDEEIRPQGRKTFLAFDGLNNVFNLAYEHLRWKVHIALLKSHLEPYLGFLHSLQYSKPSLVCDFQELYRYLIDDTIISFCREVSSKDFVFKKERRSNRLGRRQFLNEKMEKAFTQKLDAMFKSFVEIPRMRVGKRQEVETLITEEALLLAKYFRNERKDWIPRIVKLS
jgi:CRISPR-associated protein Cas1